MKSNRIERYNFFFSFLRKKKPVDLDTVCRDINKSVFRQIDCLDCARCCKTITPIILYKDIEVLSKYLKLNMDNFEREYLIRDEDGYSFNSVPCPFLIGDNRCKVYDYRPKSCREYPHIDRKKIYQIKEITLKNSKICIAVGMALDKMIKHYNFKK